MKWKLVNESKTPADDDSINSALNGDVSDEMYSPTVEFAKAAYQKLNRELFLNYLPPSSEITFELSDDIRSDELGSAECTVYSTSGRTFASDFKLTLDKTATLTLHSWIGVVLHEMIHILDYQEHPDHKDDKSYDFHGEWFRKMGERFKKHGFNVSKFYSGNSGIDIDDERIDQIMKEEIFIQIGKTESGVPQLVKIHVNDKDRVLKFLRDEENVDEVVVLTTENPMSVKLVPLDIHELERETFKVYRMSDKFNKNFGPFNEVETIDLNGLVSEGTDDYDEEVEVIRHQKGVIKAERVGKNAIRIVVS